MDYSATLSYLYEQLPMYQRMGPAAFKKDLSNTIALCEALDNPHKQFKCIHVAGTNGKGSVTHIIGSILQAQGHKVGLYTSPHYKDFRERIKVNGQFMTEEAVVDFVAEHKTVIEQIQPSFFEITVAMAFDYFARQEVDYAVIEVGLGGRLDSTNVITPLLSVITNIGYDHMQFLGDTLPEIAGEKAGIIKPGIPVIIGETQLEVAEVFKGIAEEREAPILFADQLYQLKLTDASLKGLRFDLLEDNTTTLPDLSTDLVGPYQPKNLVTTLAAIHELRNQSIAVSEQAIRNGLEEVRKHTCFMGRWQVLQENPLAICDSGHNAAGLQYVVDGLAMGDHKQLHMVLGVVNDKDLSKIFPLLPKDASYYFCAANIPRALAADELAAQANKSGFKGKSYPSVNSAYQAALTAADSDDLVFVGGSVFVVAEVL